MDILITCKRCGTENTVIVAKGDRASPRCLKCGDVLVSYVSVSGYIYILSNPRMKGLLKIGLSTRAVKERIAELSSATGVPAPFEVEAYFVSSDPEGHEQQIHASNNQFGFDNAIWSDKYAKLVAERRGKFDDASFIDNLQHTPEFTDLNLLLRGLSELGAETLKTAAAIDGPCPKRIATTTTPRRSVIATSASSRRPNENQAISAAVAMIARPAA